MRTIAPASPIARVIPVIPNSIGWGWVSFGGGVWVKWVRVGWSVFISWIALGRMLNVAYPVVWVDFTMGIASSDNLQVLNWSRKLLCAGKHSKS